MTVSIGLGRVGSKFFHLQWVGLGQSADGLGWIGSHKMDPWTTLTGTASGRSVHSAHNSEGLFTLAFGSVQLMRSEQALTSGRLHIGANGVS